MNVVSRRDWKARPPRSQAVLPAEDVDWLVVHYSASNADEQALHHNCAGRVRGIQNYHMDIHGWDDIAYNWLVCKHGYIYRGRGWLRRSAATGNANGYTVAVCFLGDDTAYRDDVTDAGRMALRVVWDFVKEHGPNVQGVKGHRDFMATSCPGAELYKFLRTLK